MLSWVPLGCPGLHGPPLGSPEPSWALLGCPELQEQESIALPNSPFSFLASLGNLGPGRRKFPRLVNQELGERANTLVCLVAWYLYGHCRSQTSMKCGVAGLCSMNLMVWGVSLSCETAVGATPLTSGFGSWGFVWFPQQMG